jgi:urease accessory protein
MPRAIKVLVAGQHRDRSIVDTLILPLERRRNHRGFVFTAKGTCIELDLEPPVWMRTDDALVLDDGSLIEVVAEAEPLLEVRAVDLATLARIAWMLGDRHVPVQILANRLRLRRDPALRTLLANAATRLTEVEAPFDPEGGAYSATSAGEHHHHDHHSHDHDHRHDHHDHGDGRKARTHDDHHGER